VNILYNVLAILGIVWSVGCLSFLAGISFRWGWQVASNRFKRETGIYYTFGNSIK